MRLLVAAAAVAATLIAGCGGGAEPTTETGGSTSQATTPSPTAPASVPTTPPVTSPPATAAAAPGTVIITADSEFGPMLFDERGQAIYLFDKEKSPTPECYDACAAAWPPVLTQGAPVAMADVRPELLGTSPRTDGTTQVTYAGHPLYFYANEGPNEVRCHNVNLNGGLWFVVTPSGEAAPA